MPVGATSDPALEPTSDGRTLLQARLSLYAKVLLAISVSYWPCFLLIWSREPTVGFDAAWRHVVSAPTLALHVLYVCMWIAGSGRPKPALFLRLVDLGSALAIGVIFALITRSHPGHLAGLLEDIMAVVSVLAVRALVVPSPLSRTLAASALVSVPAVINVVLDPKQFGDALAHGTLIGVVIVWVLVGVAFSSVASTMLYGLRREVRDARRLGQYTLGEKLGEGGMGVVYRASHAMLRRPTAIKLLSRQGAGSLERFEREVQLLAGLNHPNTVTIHDYGRTADGIFYYAMELLDGLDLERLVSVDGPQPARRVIHVVRQAARALGEAHALGLVHRDVKPANIFLCRRWGEADAVKVLDFGLAKDLAAGLSADLTGSRTILGTPLYIAPEALTDDGPDARADLYSLGAVAYWLLAGAPVFTGGTAMEVCAHHLHSAPVPPSQRLGRPVPADLEAIVLRCLAKSPGDRYPDAAALEAALAACADASSWTQVDARAWWGARGDGHAAGSSRRVAVSGEADTVAIDTAGRN